MGLWWLWGGVGGARGVGGDLSALEEKYCHLAKVEVDEMSEKLERSKKERLWNLDKVVIFDAINMKRKQATLYQQASHEGL